MVPTLAEDIYSNRFAAEDYTVWTLYNAADTDHVGEVLRIKHIANARYIDAWNQTELVPTIHDGVATVAVPLSPKGVGCVVQIHKR